jgi:hypothetical protein
MLAPLAPAHSHAADRVFRIAVVLASPSVVPAARGPSPLAAKPAAGHGAWVSGTPAGTSAGCMKIPGDSWLGDGRRPRISGGDRASERHGGAVLYGLSRRA